jgi:hypothetical protein
MKMETYPVFKIFFSSYLECSVMKMKQPSSINYSCHEVHIYLIMSSSTHYNHPFIGENNGLSSTYFVSSILLYDGVETAQSV